MVVIECEDVGTRYKGEKKGKAGLFIWGMGKWFSYGHMISRHWTHNCHDFCLNSPDLHSLVFSSVCCFFSWLFLVSTSQNKGSDAFSSTSTQLKLSLHTLGYVVQIPWFKDKFSEFEIKVVWHWYFILWMSFIIYNVSVQRCDIDLVLTVLVW